MGTYADFHDPYLVHVLSPESDRFIHHTAETFKVMCNTISEEVRAGRPHERYEVMYGINYVEDGVLFDNHCLDVMQTPLDLYWDPMHVLFASGGVAQYHCNGLIKILVDNGVPIAGIDAWTSMISMPNYQLIKPNWIVDRFVYSDYAHIKAFASDCMAIIDCIALFIQVVLAGTAKYTLLVRYMECFRHLKCIPDILRTKSASPGAIRKLRQVVKQHHTLFVDLYPNLCKPKLHYLAHIADCIERFKSVLTCFSGESLHRLGKSIMRSAYKKSTGATLSASLQTMRAAVLDKKAFIEVYLEPTIYTIDDPAARTAILTHVRANGLGIFCEQEDKNKPWFIY